MASGSIICGVNGSEHVCPVVHVAERLAKHLGAELVLVHVSHVRVSLPHPPGISYEQLEAKGIETGKKLLRWVEEECRLGPSKGRVEIGDPARVLLRLSEEDDVEMIVVGSRGRGRLKAALLESVSGEVASHARCPVVVVPPEAGSFHTPEADETAAHRTSA